MAPAHGPRPGHAKPDGIAGRGAPPRGPPVPARNDLSLGRAWAYRALLAYAFALAAVAAAVVARVVADAFALGDSPAMGRALLSLLYAAAVALAVAAFAARVATLA